MCIPPGPPHLPTKERPLHVLLGGRTVGVHNPVRSSCECISLHFKRYIEVECREKAEQSYFQACSYLLPPVRRWYGRIRYHALTLDPKASWIGSKVPIKVLELVTILESGGINR